MKKTIISLAILAALIGGAIYVGLTHGGGGVPQEEIDQRLLLVEKFLDQSNAGKALEVFAEMDEKGFGLDEKGERLRVIALGRAGHHDKAAAAAKTFLEEYPNSPDKTSVELVRLSSELATSGLGNPVLRKSVEDFLAQNPSHPGAAKLQIALAEQEISLGDYAAAERRLARIMESTNDDATVLKLAEPLGRVNLEELWSPALSDGDIQYTVERGDTINGIAAKYDVTQELLMRCNNIDDPRKLRIGQKLKVPNTDFSIHVDIAANTLSIRNHGEFFKMYPVRTGREVGTTPTGEYKILNKKRNPTWRPGNGYVYMAGDPNNELGTRWMAFEGDLLGIHGTIHEETVGEYASNGCIGMKQADVEEFFDLIMVGTPLTISGEQDLQRHKVVEAPELIPPQQVAKK